jgi:RHS repeat-associated protein
MASAPMDANSVPACQQILAASDSGLSSCPPPSSPPDNCDCPPCDCTGASTGDCTDHSSSSYSGQPVRYASGQIRLVEQDLASNGFGVAWGHTRSYSNRVTAPDQGLNGSSWFVKEAPQVANLNPGADPNQATMVVMGVINDALWFDWVQGSSPPQYQGRFFYQSKLTYDSTNGLLILTDPVGQQVKFFDFKNANTPGQLYSFVDRGNNEYKAVYSNNLISSLLFQSGAQPTGYVYAYYSSGVNANRLQYVTLEVNAVNVRRVQYDYHDGSDAYGSAGDLRRAIVQQWNGSSWDTLTTSYYRYYKSGDVNGFAHGLKYVLSPLGYARMVALGITPEIATDGQIAGFAKHFFKYDANKRVTDEVVSGGALSYGFAFTQGASSTDYNVNVSKMVETLPDGNQNIVFTNFAGQVMLKVFKRVSDGAQWYEYHQYSGQGQVTLRAESSAVSSYSTDPNTGLLTGVMLKTSAGLIHTYDYYTSGALYYLEDEKVQQGSGGSSILVRQYTYTSQTVGATTIYLPWKEICYPSATDQTLQIECKIYSYTWQGSTFLINQRTTTWPVVSSSQNGSGSADSRIESFDAHGRVSSVQEERGYTTDFTYDNVTGGLTQRVEDVGGTGHLNLTTDYTVDGLGRMTQELGPAHSIDLSGVSTQVRRARWVVYQDANHQQWEGMGYQKTSDGSFTLINPVKLTFMDNSGRVTDEIQATRASTSGALSSTDSFGQGSYVRWGRNNYQGSLSLGSRQEYYQIPGSGYGSRGVNYNETDYAYDLRVRAVREVNPGGTITRRVYHARGWVLERWVGTNDNGATDGRPDGGGAPGNNMVKVEANQYDSNTAGGDGNLTQRTEYQDGTTSRVTSYQYDFRDRQTVVDGEIDFYQVTTYDNLDRVVQVDRYDTSAAGNLVARGATNYDARGRIYQAIVYAVDPSTGAVGNALTDNFWYDPSGNLIKQRQAGSSTLVKRVLDALGRAAKEYTSYNTSETGYPYPISVANDTVFRQVENSYDNASNVIEQTTRERFDNATGTGELTSPSGSQPQARVSYVAYWPDALGRALNVADYGTNGATALSRPATAPARSATVLVTSTDYNDRGEADQVTDPKGTINQSTFDDAGRLTKLVENVVSGGTNPDQNRETDYTYNADGKVASLTAKNGTTGDQVTQYVYGTTLSDSDVASNELLRTVIYPDDTPSAPDRVTLAYNRLGELKQKQDQLGTVHSLGYDLLGRLSNDHLGSPLPAGVDGTVRRIGYAYEVRGMVKNVTSYDVNSNVVNDMLLSYNNFAQLVAEYQSHAGAATTGSPSVQYGYANGSANTVRPTALTYPNGRVLNYNYGASGGANDLLSRVGSLLDNDGVTHLADYTYVGVERIVQASSPQPGVMLTYIKQASEPVGDGGDKYTGWDRFSRVVDQRWVVASTYAALERLQYGFDQASNRQWRANVVAEGLNANQDEYYTYDGLYQLKVLQRGTLKADRSGLTTTPNWEEDYTFDPTGNWTNYVNKVSGTTTLNQNRTHNKANEIATIAGSNLLIAQDAAGEVTKAPKPSDWSSAYTMVWDAWNRLVKVMDGGTTVGAYAYDGQNRRVTKTTGTTTRHYYYTQQWQSVEERLGTNTTADRQFVWGRRSLDDLVLRDRGSERFYAFDDGLNCTAIADTSGTVQERYGYDGFGSSRVMTPSFGSRTPSSYDWETRFGDYRWDGESGYYQVRYRFLHSKLGRWLSRDPLGEPGFELNRSTKDSHEGQERADNRRLRNNRLLLS